MEHATPTSTDVEPVDTSEAAAAAMAIEEELLVEEISIDGMCGVY